MFVRPTITSLEIVNDYYGHVGQLEVGPLLSILSGLPLLRVLRLHFPYPPEPKEDPSGSNLPNVHLSRLEELDLTTQSDACLLILSHISFHPKVNVSVSIVGTWETISLTQMWSHQFITSTRNTNLINRIMERLRFLVLDHSPPPYRLFLANETEDKSVDWEFRTQISSHTGHSLTIRMPHVHVDCVIGSFPLQDIEEIEFVNDGRVLDISNGTENHSQHWIRTIAASSVVFRGMVVPFTSFLGFLTVPITQQMFLEFSAAKSAPDRKPHSRVVLPNLKSLIVFDVAGETDSHRLPDGFIGEIRSMLDSREAGGAPIKKFLWHQDMFRSPMFHDESLEELETYLYKMGIESELNVPVHLWPDESESWF